MVIATCESCNTLVSIGDGLNKRSDGEGDVRSVFCEEHILTKTELFLPEDDFFDTCCNDDDEDDDDNWSMNPSRNVQLQNVYLPSNEVDAVDECLQSNPSIMETAEELLANAPRVFSSNSKERVLYVAQGEMAHAVPTQCDVIVSDKSTTCHILAVRSTSASAVGRGGAAPTLVSLTHVDGTGYEDCIRNMIAEHKIHHCGSQRMISGWTHQDEKKD